MRQGWLVWEKPLNDSKLVTCFSERRMTLGCLCAPTADRWTLMTLNGASFLMSLKCFLSVLPQTRKPLVEKKRRARINESLQELRTLLADTDVSTERTQLLHWSFTFALRHNEGVNRGLGGAHLVSFLSFIPRWRTQRCWSWPWKRWRTYWRTGNKVCPNLSSPCNYKRVKICFVERSECQIIKRLSIALSIELLSLLLQDRGTFSPCSNKRACEESGNAWFKNINSDEQTRAQWGLLNYNFRVFYTINSHLNILYSILQEKNTFSAEWSPSEVCINMLICRARAICNYLIRGSDILSHKRLKSNIFSC